VNAAVSWPAQGQEAGRRSVAPAGVEREASCDVQEPVAQAFGFGLGELAGEQQPLGPGDQVVREAPDLEPHLVVFEGPEREVPQAGVFVVADVVLDAGAPAVITLELGDRAGLVGEDRLEAITVVVGEGELRAGCARSRRTMTRVPCGQRARSRCSVISQTSPFERACPS